MKLTDFHRNDTIGFRLAGPAGRVEYGTVWSTCVKGGFEWIIARTSWGEIGVLPREVEHYRPRGY